MRNGSLSSGVVFEKEVIFYEFDFETSDLEFEVSNQASESTQPRVTSFFYLLGILLRNFDDRLSSNFHRFVIFTACEKTSL